MSKTNAPFTAWRGESSSPMLLLLTPRKLHNPKKSASSSGASVSTRSQPRWSAVSVTIALVAPMLQCSFQQNHPKTHGDERRCQDVHRSIAHVSQDYTDCP